MQLNTAEKFLLIAHHPEKSRFTISSIQMEYGIIGAILMDLTLDNKVTLENKILVPAQITTRSQNQAFTEIITMIGDSVKPRTVKHWISRLARRYNRYKWLLIGELENKNIIRIENKKLLGLIPYRSSYLTENIARSNLIQQLKNNILFGKELNNEAIAILGMVEACSMHKLLAPDRDERKKLKTQLKQVIKESPIAGIVDQTIKQVQAAITLAMITSAAASSATAHH